MLYEGTRDFIKSYARMGFDPEETVKSEVKKNALPKYLTVFEKVSITLKSPHSTTRICSVFVVQQAYSLKLTQLFTVILDSGLVNFGQVVCVII